jgi:hypothetical protein
MNARTPRTLTFALLLAGVPCGGLSLAVLAGCTSGTTPDCSDAAVCDPYPDARGPDGAGPGMPEAAARDTGTTPADSGPGG